MNPPVQTDWSPLGVTWARAGVSPTPSVSTSVGQQTNGKSSEARDGSFDPWILVPVLIGAFITIAGQTALEFVKDNIARKKETRDASQALAKEARDQASTIEREAKARAQDAALEADRMISELSRMLRTSIKEPEPEGQEARGSRESLDNTFDELSAQMAFLPTDLRARVDEIVSLLRNSRRIGRTRDRWNVPYHYFHASIVVERSANEAHELIASFLGHRPIPDRSSEVIELLVARDELWEANRDDYDHEIAEGEEEARRWREAHRDAIDDYMGGKAPEGG